MPIILVAALFVSAFGFSKVINDRLICLHQQLIRGVKVRPAQESGVLGKHKHGCPERAGASGSEDGGGVDGAGACKSRSPHAAVRRARQEAAAMGQMAVSI